jgi:hypothetical protein
MGMKMGMNLRDGEKISLRGGTASFTPAVCPNNWKVRGMLIISASLFFSNTPEFFSALYQ